ncbi:hypothetical protein ABZ401_08760 [Streptomyces sp. NPDC005892]|uniref:hypothetical protein n=1 Tax=Streptomyces sp. NPDC005892 TaxID=3155593 RepID=UPI0033CD6E02
MLETSGVGYVLAVPKSQFSLAGPRIDMVFDQAPDQAWERRSCGAGAKGRREYNWAAVQLRPVAEYDHQDGVLIRRRWALARRSLSRPDEIAYYRGYAPLDVGVDELVRVAGFRWAIEECFQAAKKADLWASIHRPPPGMEGIHRLSCLSGSPRSTPP